MLGIHLDQKLSWSPMIDLVSNRIMKTKYVMTKLKHSLTPEGRKLLYYAFVESHLRYGISLWGNSKGPSLNKLRIKHKSIIRSLEKAKFHTEPIMKRNNIVSQKDLYSIEMAKLAWEYHGQRLPRGILNTIEMRNQAHELRNTSDVVVPRPMVIKDNNQFDISFCKTINAMDDSLKLIRTKQTLLYKLKKCKINNYRQDVTCNYLACCECSLI